MILVFTKKITKLRISQTGTENVKLNVDRQISTLFLQPQV